MGRPGTIHTKTFNERVAAFSAVKTRQAESLPHGPERDALLLEASHLKTASHLNDWLSSPGLRSPS